MVEAAKAYNPFAKAPEDDTSNCCSHMARLGICLEPEMCFLIHKLPSAGSASKDKPSAEMSTAAKEFNPFASAGASNSGKFAVKEFVPADSAEPMSEQTGIIQMLGSMGLQTQIDAELGTIFIKKFEDCDCCHGMINNCAGDFCENFGMCFCVSTSFHEDQ